jgi:hypothetical protein
MRNNLLLQKSSSDPSFLADAAAIACICFLHPALIGRFWTKLPKPQHLHSRILVTLSQRRSSYRWYYRTPSWSASRSSCPGRAGFDDDAGKEAAASFGGRMTAPPTLPLWSLGFLQECLNGLEARRGGLRTPATSRRYVRGQETRRSNQKSGGRLCQESTPSECAPANRCSCKSSSIR